MKPKNTLRSFLAAIGASIIAISSASAVTYTWTGADGATDATWENPLNWDANGVPNGVAGQLSTSSSADVVIFNSETAAFMPSNSILTRNSWTGAFKNPQIQVLNGTVTFANNINWGWSGITSFIVGDGNMTTLAVADTGFSDLNRDPNGLKTYVVNADGTLIFRNNVAAFSNDGSAKQAQIQLNGGAVQFNGTIGNHLTNAANNYISFNAIGSTFTAAFGGQLADLATVTGQFGDSFKDTTGIGLTATDNLDGSFTVAITGPASITSFEGAGATGVIDQTAKTIDLEVPSGTNLATLAPTFTLSSGTCDQTSGEIPSPTFAAAPGNTVNYVVTDTSTEPDTVNTYAVTVTTETLDTTPPAISSLDPANGATGVPVAANLAITFDEDVAVATGFITLKNLTAVSQVQIDVMDGTQVSVAGPVLTINPASDLVPGNQYAVQIDDDAIEDLAGTPNGFAGIGNDTTWSFTVDTGTYVWTGADGATDATWENPLNWDANGVPNGVAGQLSTSSSADVVIFNSETAAFMPSDSILTRTSWTGGFKNPQIQVLNGTVTFANNINWGWSGITSFIVGDGDMTTLAVADTGFSDLNREPNGLKTYVVNVDGTLIFRNNVTAFSNDGSAKQAQIQLNGGAVQFNGTIGNHLTNAANNYISFNALGSAFTAAFGGQLPDLATVTGQFGDSFKDPNSLGLVATDNLDGSFTVAITGLGGTPYDTWAGPGAPFDDDANGDGVDNGMAFLLGASGPNVSALGLLPTVTETAGGLVLNFSMLDATARGTTAALSVEHSNTLAIGSWTTVSVPDTSSTVADVVFTITGTNPLNVTATIPVSKADGGKLFGRLQATE